MHADFPELARACQFSPYFHRLISAQHDFAKLLQQRLHTPLQTQDFADIFTHFCPQNDDDDNQIKRALRQTRQFVMAHTILRDINHLADLNEVLRVISDFADFAILLAKNALEKKFTTQYGQAIGFDSGKAQSLIVVAMGKLGGQELNVSSDVDLIFLFAENGESNGKKSLENQDYFTRMGKKLIAMLNDVTEDGFVFRVDMRLRPYGDSGPLVMSFAALENYFVAQGREWERYAWIKARVVGGEHAELASLVRPFVYRKYLDFNAYEAMRNLYGQIQREVARLDKHQNIKLGRGGIRELEFIAQVFQLIRGGRESRLQTRSTRQAFAALAHLSLLPADVVAHLQQDYAFLRELEHRLQYQHDQQTQTLPANIDEQILIAGNLGFADVASFLAKLDALRERVHQQFSEIFVFKDQATTHPLAQIWQDCAHPIPPESLPEDHQQTLENLGFKQAETLLKSLITLGSSSRYRQLAIQTRRRFDLLLPEVLQAASQFHNPDDTFFRLLALLETILRRSAYLALLAEYPQTLERVAALYSASPWMSAYINRHPILLDELLDARILYAEPDWEKIAAELEEKLAAHDNDVEAKMDTLRHVQHAMQFRLLAQDLAGFWSLEHLSDQLSLLADLILSAGLRHAWQDVRQKHRPTPRFAIISYGKLGGKELGYVADLDVVFLYEDDHPDAAQIYTRLARKLSTWLTATTSAGNLYELDLRLRPDGAAGLMVSSLERFEAYQHQQAWLWEHQALTRARFVAGDAQVGAKFEKIRDDILMQPRNAQKLAQDILQMRYKMRESHPARDDDLKHAAGGLVDVEFMVQYFVLAHAFRFPELCGNLGNIALLGMAANAGLIEHEASEAVQIAYRYFRRAQHRQRLQGEQQAEVSPELQQHYQNVRKLWQDVFGEFENAS